jgi:uncharacterized membrane protein
LLALYIAVAMKTQAGFRERVYYICMVISGILISLGLGLNLLTAITWSSYRFDYIINTIFYAIYLAAFVVFVRKNKKNVALTPALDSLYYLALNISIILLALGFANRFEDEYMWNERANDATAAGYGAFLAAVLFFAYRGKRKVVILLWLLSALYFLECQPNFIYFDLWFPEN